MTQSGLFANGRPERTSVLARFLCGVMAGAAGQTVAYPLDIIRRQMQLNRVASHLPAFKHTLDALIYILSTKGWRGLFVGLSINYIKVAPATGISFLVYET